MIAGAILDHEYGIKIRWVHPEIFILEELHATHHALVMFPLLGSHGTYACNARL